MLGILEIDHSAYQKKVKRLSADSLRYTIKDAREAVAAMPDGPKAGYYLDEISYCSQELWFRASKQTSKNNRINKREEF